MFGIRVGRTPAEPAHTQQRSMWSLPGGWGYGVPMGGPSPGLSQALLNSASYACIDVLVDHASAAPLDAIRYYKNGKARQPIYPPPPLIDNPSGIVTADIWRAQMIFAMVTDGNAFGQIAAYGAGGLPVQVEWLDPATVTHRKVVRGVPQVEIDQVVHRLYPNGDILHIPGRMIPPGSPFALSPVEYANATIGTSLSAQAYTSAWFAGSGHPSMEIIVEGLSTAEQAAGIKGSYQSMVTTGEPWVHGDGISSKEAQEKPDTTAIDVVWQAAIMACQIWHVPPTWIYVAITGQNVTYQNIAQADVAGLKDSVDVLLRRTEGALSPCLPNRWVVRANRDAILRVDALTRVQIQALRLTNKLMSVNEGREQEDEEPWPDPIYDKPGLPTVAAPAPDPSAQQQMPMNGQKPAQEPSPSNIPSTSN